jgi:hypothetical protein
MEQRPSWKANSCTSNEIPSFLWNPKGHYHVHKSLTLGPILSHMNSLHTLKICFFKIRFNIVLPSVPQYPKWSLLYGFLTKILYVFLILNACYMFH